MRARERNIAAKRGEREVEFSLFELKTDGRRFVHVYQYQDRFDGHPVSEYPRIAEHIINELFVGRVIGIDNRAFINGEGKREYAHPAKHLLESEYNAKLRASAELDNLIDAGTNFRNEPDGKGGHKHSDVIGGFDYFDVLFKIGSRYFEGVINIKNVVRGKLFKDVTQIKDVTEEHVSSYGSDPKYHFLRTSSMGSISTPSEKSNHSAENSQSANNDPDFSENPLTESPEMRETMDKARTLFEDGVHYLAYYNQEGADNGVAKFLRGLWDSANKTNVLNAALELYRAGKSVTDYYNENPQGFNYQVARQLQGMQVRNGQAIGGRRCTSVKMRYIV